jgi:5-methylcytosine-specific restriction protein A
MLRDYKRHISPICEHCLLEGKYTKFHTIDHIKPIAEGGEALDLDNLQTLCEPCHRKKSAKEIHRRMKGD